MHGLHDSILDKKLKAWLTNAKDEKKRMLKILHKLISDLEQNQVVTIPHTTKFFHINYNDFSSLKNDEEVLSMLAKEEHKNIGGSTDQKGEELTFAYLPH